MTEENATTTTTTTDTTDAATSATSSDSMEEAVAALESPEPMSDAPKATAAAEKAAGDTDEKKTDASSSSSSSSSEVVRAEAAALKARLRAEREIRLAKQRAASTQSEPQQQTQQQQQQTQQQHASTPEEDALVDVVRKAIGLQTGEKPDQKAVEEAVARLVQQQLAAHAEEQRRQAAKLAVVSHLESARDKLPLLSAFADDRIDDVYEVLIDEYVSEYRANGRKLTVAEAADRVERKLSDAIARLAGLTAKQKQQEQAAAGAKRKMKAQPEDDDPDSAVRDAIAALTSKEPRS